MRRNSRCDPPQQAPSSSAWRQDVSPRELNIIPADDIRDLVVTAEGTVFVTYFDASAGAPACFHTAQILSAAENGEIRIVAANLTCPSGMLLTADRELLVAETLGNRLISFGIEAGGGLSWRPLQEIKVASNGPV